MLSTHNFAVGPVDFVSYAPMLALLCVACVDDRAVSAGGAPSVAVCTCASADEDMLLGRLSTMSGESVPAGSHPALAGLSGNAATHSAS